MQLVTGRLKIEPTNDLRIALCISSRFAMLGFERNDTMYDTRFVPAMQTIGDRSRHLYLLLDGTCEWSDGSRFVGPAAFVVSAPIFDGEAGQRTLSYRAGGERFRSVELRVHGGELGTGGEAGPEPIALSPAAFAFAAAYLERDEPLEAARSLLERLAADGVLSASIVDGELGDVLSHGVCTVLFPVLRRLAFGTNYAELTYAGSVSRRELRFGLGRLAKTLDLRFKGWREFARCYRLRLAILLLSNPRLEIRDIAKLAGYSSTEAFTHALYDENLPAPGAIRAQILAYQA
ncbi:MAG TPA: hypothetical protein VGC41_02710 [Kofleriaceae bacterium]